MDANHSQEGSKCQIQKHFCQKETCSAVIRKQYYKTVVQKKDMQTLSTLRVNQYSEWLGVTLFSAAVYLTTLSVTSHHTS